MRFLLRRLFNLATVLHAIGWLFVAAALAVIAYPFVLKVGTFKPIENGLSAGVLVALAAQLLSQAKSAKEARENAIDLRLDQAQ